MLALLLLLAGTGYFVFTNSDKAKDKAKEELAPRLERVENLNVRVSYDTAIVTGKMVIHNPAPVPFYIDSISYNVKHSGDLLAKGHEELKETFPANGNQPLDLKLNVDFGLLDKRLVKLQKQDSMDLDFDLNLFYRLGALGTHKIPISSSVKIAVPKNPAIEMTGMKLKDFGLGDGIEVGVMMKIDNSSLDAFEIRNLVYDIQIEDFLDAHQKVDKTFQIKSKGPSFFEVPLQLGVKEGLKAGIKKTFGDKSWNYKIKGSCDIVSEDPKLKRVDISFARNDVMDMMKPEKRAKQHEKQQEDQLKDASKAASKEKKKAEKKRKRQEEDEEDEDDD